MLRLASERVAVIERPGGQGVTTERRTIDEGPFINTFAWTTPIYTEAGGVPTRFVCRQIDCGPDADFDTLTLPADAAPDPRFDGWMTVIDRSANIAYDFWRGRRERDGTISYQFVRQRNLGGPGFQQPQNVSARGSGLPLFAGIILPEELRRGVIEHALAISLPGPAQRRYVQPASRTDGLGQINSLPEGVRIRLKPGVTARQAVTPREPEEPRTPIRDRLRKLLDDPDLAGAASGAAAPGATTQGPLETGPEAGPPAAGSQTTTAP